MKVYVVYEYAVIEYEERVRNMGVFSSIEKAEAAIKEYENLLDFINKLSSFNEEYTKFSFPSKIMEYMLTAQ